MNVQPCCAHLRVTWRTEEMEKGMRGWWACTDCQSVFVPMRVYEGEIERLTRLELNTREWLQDAVAERDRLRAALEQIASRAPTQTDSCLSIAHEALKDKPT